MQDQASFVVKRARDRLGISGDPDRRISKAKYRKGFRQGGAVHRYGDEFLRDWLQFMYVERKLGTPTIAQRLDISETATYRLLERYGVRARPQHIDITGKVFGNLTAVIRVGADKYGKALWSCQCVCGSVRLVTYGCLRNSRVRSCGCLRSTTCTREKNCNWKGGRMYDGNGYIKIKLPDSPMADRYGYVSEHKQVVSQRIGRPLRKGETVHHKNGIRNDNRDENLELWDTNHPAGQRVQDKLDWCVEFIRIHAPGLLISAALA